MYTVISVVCDKWIGQFMHLYRHIKILCSYLKGELGGMERYYRRDLPLDNGCYTSSLCPPGVKQRETSVRLTSNVVVKEGNIL